MALSQGLSGVQDVFNGINLLLPNSFEYTKNNIRLFWPHIPCQIDHESMLKRISSDLKGVFDSRSLKALRTGLNCVHAQFIIAFWLWEIRPDQSSVEYKLGQDIMWLCTAEKHKVPQEMKTQAPYVIPSHAIYGMAFCLARVDKHNRSISSGNKAIGAQFLFISYVSHGIFRDRHSPTSRPYVYLAGSNRRNTRRGNCQT